jgi:uncharacterized protein (UPF0332 family)
MKTEFLTKSQENLKAAQLLFDQGFYNASANRSYYSAFQAAIAALADLGIVITERKNHETTQANFAAELIKKRKVYPSHLKSYLLDLQDVRNTSDYREISVSKKIADRQLRNAKEFVELIVQRLIK